MKKHTASFKEEIKTLGKQQKVQLIYDDRILDDEIINMVTYHYEGDLLKSIMKGLEIDININIPLGSEIGLKYGLLVNGAYEYIDYGKYIVYEVEKQEDTGSYNIICYDKLLYSMKPYEKMNVSYPISIEDYLKTICSHLQIDYSDKNQNFVNYSKIIPTELYLDNLGTDLGYTFRDVLDEIAQATASVICINNDDELEVRYINDTGDTIDEEYLKDVNVNFGQKYGKINSVVLSRSAESDNVFISDEESIEQNGLCEIKIIDNQIMNFNNRDEFLPEMFNMLNGLEYCINDFSSTGVLYYDILDRYNVRIGENSYSCIMLNDEINITQGLEEVIYTNIPETSKTDYSKSDKTDRRINQTYLIVDKQNQKIESVVSQIGDRTNKTTSITQDLESIESKVNNVVGITNELYGINELVLNDCMLGDLLEFRIIGNNTVFKQLITGQFKVGPNALVSTGKARIRVIGEELDTSGEVINTTETIHDFGVIGVLRQLGDVYDEFVLQDKKIRVIRRIAVTSDGELFVRETPEIQELGEWSIPLVRGRNRISIIGFTANMYAKWVIINDYTNMFVPQVEFESKFEQEANKIEVSVTQKVTENVSEKSVMKDNIIASLNIAVENDQGIIDIFGNVFKLKADNIEITEDGTAILKAGKIANWNIEQDHLSAEGEGLFYPTKEDVELAYSITMGIISGSDFLKFLYDVNNDGKLSLLDAGKMSQYIDGTGTIEKYVKGKVEINTDNPVRAFVAKNPDTGAETVVGVAGIQTDRISTEIITANTIELGEGTLLMKIAGYKKKIVPASSYTNDHLYQFGYDAEEVGGLPTLKLYIDTTFVGNLVTVLPEHKHVNTPLADGSGVYILTSKVTYLEVQDGLNTYGVTYNVSDSKLKNNMVETKVKALEVIDKIKHYSFDWKHNGEHIEIGYKADELFETDNILANRIKQPDGSYLHQFDNNNILALCTKSIQELNAKIEKRDKIIEFLAEKLNCKDEVLEMLKEGE